MPCEISDMDNNNDRKLSDSLPEVASVDQQARHKSAAKVQTDSDALTGQNSKVNVSFFIHFEFNSSISFKSFAGSSFIHLYSKFKMNDSKLNIKLD